nr:hypothetical protein [Tanacetum cinerariifolium]
MNDFLNTMQSFCEKLLQQQEAANIDQSPLQEMSLKEIEDLKQHYLDEMLSLSNDLGIKDYQNEKERVANLNAISSQRFNSFYYDDDYDYKESDISLNETISQETPSNVITTSPLMLPTKEAEDSLIIRNKEHNTILEKESNEFIKSSVEDLFLILSESKDTSGSESVCILPLCNDISPIDVPKEKAVTFSNPLFNSNDDFISIDDESLSDEDVPEDNVKIYSNPLFEFVDEYISITPLSGSNEDEYFTPGDEVELLLHHDPSIPKMSVASILEGFTDEPPLEENDDLFDLEPKNDDWKKILYDAPILMTEDKIFDPVIHD